MSINDFSYFLERYISNEMGADEKKWFEKEIDGNADLANELELRRKAESIIKNSDIIDLRAKLKTIETSRADRKVIRRSKQPQIMSYAAVFAGLLITGSLIFLSGNNLNKNAVYNKYYKTYESVAATRSATSEVTSLYNKAIGFYNNGDYLKAAQTLEKLLSSDQGNMEYRFQLANSYMGMQSYPEAGKSYLKVIEDNNNLFIEDAQWYLGICYIMTNENEKAKNQMRIISASDSRYNKEAKKLLRKIE
jgi:tetratricopeptide (TPR) repeat protein